MNCSFKGHGVAQPGLAEDAGPPVLAVALVCLGVPFATCKDMAESAAGSGPVGGVQTLLTSGLVILPIRGSERHRQGHSRRPISAMSLHVANGTPRQIGTTGRTGGSTCTGPGWAVP